jgi:hypothetical protein
MSQVFQVVLLFKDSRGRFMQPALLQRDLEALHLADLRRGLASYIPTYSASTLAVFAIVPAWRGFWNS